MKAGQVPAFYARFVFNRVTNGIPPIGCCALSCWGILTSQHLAWTNWLSYRNFLSGLGYFQYKFMFTGPSIIRLVIVPGNNYSMIWTKKLKKLCLVCLLTVVNPLLANPVVTPNVNAQLIVESTTVKPGESFWVALKLDIREGWHTYWRNPGDSGQATAINWVLPEGVTAGKIQWTYPERQYVGPVANYGYHGTVLHLVEMQLDSLWSVGQSVEMTAQANWLVCEEECIPEKANLEVSILSSDATPDLDPAHVEAFASTRTKLPQPLEVKVGYQYLSENQSVRLEFSPHPQLLQAKHIEFFPFKWGFIQAPADQQLIINPGFVAMNVVQGDLSFDQPVGGVLVVSQPEGETVAYSVNAQPGPLVHAIEPVVSIGLVSALILAFIGGVILNLMPCVFPVLSIKAMGLVSQAGESPRSVRSHGWVYCSGILTSFALLGIVLLLLKAAGEQIGWGFQLQSPLFVSLIAILMYLMGLSLSGFFELGISMMNRGSGLAQKPAYTGSFFTGVLAVVVATPCTAPLMGPALGYGLTQPPIIAMSVLMSLGLGLAFPYLLLSYLPVLSKKLPKPGVWMERFKQFLAFPMYLTAAWLAWVLGQQIGSNGMFLLLVVLITVTFLIWLLKSLATISGAWGIAGKACSGVVSVAVLGILFVINSMNLNSTVSASTESEKPGPAFEAFKQAKLDSLLAQGQPVFINMTAAWCITCLANEQIALSSTKLSDFFIDRGITYMKGDWTNQDAEITRYLQSFGRSSVPLYVYYPPGTDQPRILPQILTLATVMEYMSPTEAANHLAKLQ